MQKLLSVEGKNGTDIESNLRYWWCNLNAQ